MTTSLRIATYNVQHFQNTKEVTESIKKLAQTADILCLQECNHFDGFEKAKKILDPLLPGWEVVYFYEEQFGKFHGFATLWRKDIVSCNYVKALLLPQLPKFPVPSPLEPPAGRAAKRRGALLTTFRYGDKTVRVINVHLDLRGGMRQRLKQLFFLTKKLEEHVHTQEIICGDFNAVGFRGVGLKRRTKKLMNILGEEYINAFPSKTTTHDMLASIETGLPSKRLIKLLFLLQKTKFRIYQQLDYIFVKGMKITNAKSCEFSGSDHFPLLVVCSFE